MSSNQESSGQYSSDLVRFGISNLGAKTLSEEVIPLLEERLIVDITQRKVGEIVIRKEIESHTLRVQIPIRREKLIVEQVSPTYKRLAEVDLGQQETSEDVLAAIQNGSASVEAQQHSPTSNPTQSPPKVYGDVRSVEAALAVLSEIAATPDHHCDRVRIEIVLHNAKHKNRFQSLLDHAQSL